MYASFVSFSRSISHRRRSDSEGEELNEFHAVNRSGLSRASRRISIGTVKSLSPETMPSWRSETWYAWQIPIWGSLNYIYSRTFNLLRPTKLHEINATIELNGLLRSNRRVSNPPTRLHFINLLVYSRLGSLNNWSGVVSAYWDIKSSIELIGFRRLIASWSLTWKDLTL